MEIWQYILLYCAVLGGGSLAFWFKSNNRKFLQRILSFVGAYLLGILVLHLIPDAYSSGNEKIGLWVLAGFFIQLALEQFSLGVEHGHIHDHHHTSRPLFALQVVLSLSIHAFMEGLPLSNHDILHAAGHLHEHDVNQLYYGVILHKAPEAFALALLLLMSHFSKKVVIISIVLFAAMSPMGALLTQLIDFSTDTQHIMIAIVIGSLLHISTTILFEIDNTDEHRISMPKLMAIVAGVGLAILVTV